MKLDQYILRWFVEDKAFHYFGGGTTQKDTKRFSSAAEARSARFPLTYYGAGGPNDKCGWKVVRLAKKAKT